MNRIISYYKLIRNTISFMFHYLKNKKNIGSLLKNTITYRKLYQQHKMEIEEYFLYQLNKPDLKETERLAFIGWQKHIESLLLLNPIQYRCITQDKLIFYCYCKSFNISTPEIYSVYDTQLKPNKYFNSISTIDELISFLSKESLSEFVIKPTNGTRGQSVMVLRFDLNEKLFYKVNGEKISVQDISETINQYNYNNTTETNFLIQQRLTPLAETTVLSSYCPLSYRVITLLKENNVPEILFVYAKAAIGSNYLDNRRAEGLTCLLDSDGMCIGARSLVTGNSIIENHPTTNFKLSGWYPPNFNEVCELAKKAACSFFQVKCIAWDIIVANEGIFVVEGNNPWNKGIQEVYNKGLWQGIFKEQVLKLQKLGPRKSPWFVNVS